MCKNAQVVTKLQAVKCVHKLSAKLKHKLKVVKSVHKLSATQQLVFALLEHSPVTTCDKLDGII